jgi:hypothetical protein
LAWLAHVLSFFCVVFLVMPTPSRPVCQRWIVTLAGDETPPKVVEALRAQGFKVDQVLEAVGVITGQASTETVERLRSLPSVQAIEPDQAIQLPDPDAEVTW